MKKYKKLYLYGDNTFDCLLYDTYSKVCRDIRAQFQNQDPPQEVVDIIDIIDAECYAPRWIKDRLEELDLTVMLPLFLALNEISFLRSYPYSPAMIASLHGRISDDKSNLFKSDYRSFLEYWKNALEDEEK